MTCTALGYSSFKINHANDWSEGRFLCSEARRVCLCLSRFMQRVLQRSSKLEPLVLKPVLKVSYPQGQIGFMIDLLLLLAIYFDVLSDFFFFLFLTLRLL